MSLSRTTSFGARRLRIAMVIDHLESGGAQRQFCLLATSLRRANYHVEISTLRADPFFTFLLAGSPRIHVNYLAARTRIQLYLSLRRWLRRFKPAIVLSFLSWPNLLVELAGIPYRSFSVLVSERNTDTRAPGYRRRVRYILHRLADSIVSNSYAQARLIARIDHLLAPRTTVIPNAVDTDYFHPSSRRVTSRTPMIRILVLARLAPQKNALRLIAAIKVIRSRRPELPVYVDWYAKMPQASATDVPRWERTTNHRALVYFRTVEAAISAYTLEDRFRIHAPIEDVRPLYHGADVVCLPSVHEGYPNVIAEAMACGVPVLASAVGDTARLVDHGRSGFLFNPLSVEKIADAIVRFSELSDQERRDLGTAGRAIAESLLSVEVYASRYIRLIRHLTCRLTKR